MIRKRKHQLVAYVFVPVGILILVAAGIWTIKQYDFVTNSDMVKGSVVEIVEKKSDDGYSYSPRVEFMTNEDEAVSFISQVYSSIPAYREGEVVWVRYYRSDPQVAEIDSLFSIWGGVFFAWILGLIFTAAGISILAIILIRNSIIKELEVANRPIEAKITDVKRSSVGSRNNHPYIIYAEYEDGGMVYKFKSDPVPFNPASMIKRSTVTVFVQSFGYEEILCGCGFGVS